MCGALSPASREHGRRVRPGGSSWDPRGHALHPPLAGTESPGSPGEFRPRLLPPPPGLLGPSQRGCAI